MSAALMLVVFLLSAALIVATYLVFRWIVDLAAKEWVGYVVAAILWVGWVSLLFGRAAAQLVPEIRVVLRRVLR